MTWFLGVIGLRGGVGRTTLTQVRLLEAALPPAEGAAAGALPTLRSAAQEAAAEPDALVVDKKR